MSKKLPFLYIFDSDGYVLLLHRIDRNTREPIKGGVENDESVEEAIIRETYEETGLIVPINSIKLCAIVENKNILLEKYFYYTVINGKRPFISINHIKSGGEDHDLYDRFSVSDIGKLEFDYPNETIKYYNTSYSQLFKPGK